MRDREWINTVLAFLKAWVVVGARGGAREMGIDGMTDEEKKAWLGKLVKDLGMAARELESGEHLFCFTIFHFQRLVNICSLLSFMFATLV